MQIPDLQEAGELVWLVEHLRPQAPQSVALDWRFVSQPFALFPSQSPQPASHDPE